MYPYEEMRTQSRELSQKMRMGTGVSNILHHPDPSTHYMDALERFQKNFSQYDKIRREQETQKRYQEIERRRISMLEREGKRWELMEEYERKLKSREEENMRLQNAGVRRLANRNGLPYNPINLQYENNPEGQKLKNFDEEQKIRGYVRAHNMDKKGNCQYNLINGQNRIGIDLVVPEDLKPRYEIKKVEHYENERIKLPPSSLKEMRLNRYY